MVSSRFKSFAKAAFSCVVSKAEVFLVCKSPTLVPRDTMLTCENQEIPKLTLKSPTASILFNEADIVMPSCKTNERRSILCWKKAEFLY